MGDLLLQKTYTVDYLTKHRILNKGIVPKYFVAENHEPIIARDMFIRVQEEKLRRAYFTKPEGKTKKHRGSVYPLTSRLVCSECGENYTRVSWHKPEKCKIVWRCSNRLRSGATDCKNSPSVPEKELHLAIWNAYNQFRGLKEYHSGEEIFEEQMQKLYWLIQERRRMIRNHIEAVIQGFLQREYFKLLDFI